MEAKVSRRSRMRKKPTGRRIVISNNDLKILSALDRYRYLRSTFLHALVGGSKIAFQHRLKNLFHETTLLERPEQQWQFANCRYMPTVYSLAKEGYELLRERGPAGSPRPILKPGQTGAGREFAHELMISDILASIEIGIRQRPSLRFVGCHEILARAPKIDPHPLRIPVSISHTFRNGQVDHAETAIVPDGLFGIEYGGKTYRFFALEADRGTMPVERSSLLQTSYLKKLLGYKRIIEDGIFRSHLGIPNLFVLTVTCPRERMDNIMALGRRLGLSRFFLFKTISTLGDFEKAPLPSPHILTEPWARLDMASLDIRT